MLDVVNVAVVVVDAVAGVIVGFVFLSVIKDRGFGDLGPGKGVGMGHKGLPLSLLMNLYPLCIPAEPPSGFFPVRAPCRPSLILQRLYSGYHGDDTSSLARGPRSCCVADNRSRQTDWSKN